MGIFEEHLKQTTRKHWGMLLDPNAGFNYTPETFVYYCLSSAREIWERLSKPPFVDFFAETTQPIEFDLKLKFKNCETAFEHTTLGIRITRVMRDDFGNEQNVDQN